MLQGQLGWKKDPRDERDYLHLTMEAVPVLPESVNLYSYLPEVRNQGSSGSCVGHGIGANITATYKQQKGDPEWESPAWIYNLGRMKTGRLAYDEGTYPRDALDQLLKFGLLKEHWWPYKGFDSKGPDSKQMDAAVRWADFAYFRCVDGIDGILSALAEGRVVSIGAPWFTKWNNPKNGILPAITDDDIPSGGHETCLYGFSQSTQLLLGMNSWGKGYGNNGFYQMPFSVIPVFKKFGGYDAHYVTFTPVEVAPNPPKPKPGCFPGAKIIASMIRRGNVA